MPKESMSIGIENLGKFIFEYISKYREGYERFTSLPPNGAGYPKYTISPFLKSEAFEVILAEDGVVINEVANEPEHQWYIVGGSALKVDFEPTKTPSEVTQFIKDNGLAGKPIGIYRIVAKEHIPAAVWKGKITNISFQKIVVNDKLNVSLHLTEVKTSLKKLVSNLTFGAYGIVLDPHLPDKRSSFGEPYIIEKLGFFPADLNNRRFFNYIEIFGQSDIEAWDERIISLRVKHDLRRDFAKTLSSPEGSNGGLISMGSTNWWVENYTNRLGKLKQAIDDFRNILLFQSHETEDVFHKLIEKHPILLDVYGSCESKPKLHYPDGELSPIGKTYVEPDFIVSYADQSYKLVELERASKNVATKQGQPRAEVSQAAFQTAEWVHYIREHYSQIRTRYPGIHIKCRASLIMSRSTQSSFNNVEDINRYKEMIIQQFKIDEFLTYDDLFDRACTAYTVLTGLSPHGI
jgi:hypothetical protein